MALKFCVLVKFRLPPDYPGWPNWGVLVVVKASARNCRLILSVKGKFLKTEESRLLKPAPGPKPLGSVGLILRSLRMLVAHAFAIWPGAYRVR
jgi:hypothetical protein